MAAKATADAEDVTPQAAPAGRYAAMRNRCPFAIATPVSTPAPPQPSFAANWYVGGIARVGEVDFVSIKAKDLSSQFSFFGKEPDVKSGVSLVGIEWVEGIGKSVVTIQKGTELAKLEFNEAVVHGPPQNPVAQNPQPNGKPQAVVVAPPSTAGMKTAPVSGGYGQPNGARMPPTGAKPPTAGSGLSQPLPKQPYQVPNGASKPVMPYPRRQIGLPNQPVR